MTDTTDPLAPLRCRGPFRAETFGSLSYVVDAKGGIVAELSALDITGCRALAHAVNVALEVEVRTEW